MKSNSKMKKSNTGEDEGGIKIEKYTEEPWNIIESYFQGKHLERLVRHQIESYNDFVNYQIQKTINMFNNIKIVSEKDYVKEFRKHKLEIMINFGNFRLFQPQIHENNGATKMMFPQEARLRNFTYCAPMTLDMSVKYLMRSGEKLENTQIMHNNLDNIHIGKIPIMLNSSLCLLKQYEHINNNLTGECKYDAGGYFIINGSEKIVLGQERAAENKIYCFNSAKNNSKYKWIAEIKSVPDFKCISPKQINMTITSRVNAFGYPIEVQIPRLKQSVPLFIVFRALGIISDKDICEKIVLNLKDDKYVKMTEELKSSVIDSNSVLTQEDAIQFITNYVMYTPMNMDKDAGQKKKYDFTLEVLKNDLFPHCHNTTERIYFLGYMANRLLQTSFGWQGISDRDSYVNKRIDMTGNLLNNLFRNYFNKLVKDMTKQIIKEINEGSWQIKGNPMNIINMTNIYKMVKPATIENGIKKALSTGDFSVKTTNSNKVGVAQVANRLTYISCLSHLRRINTPIDKSGKLIPPRKLHNSSWGFLCPAETPEGASVGVVKNLAYLTNLTIPSNSVAIYEYINQFIIPLNDKICEYEDFSEKVKVFVNGAWIGISENPIELYNNLKKKKHSGIFNIYTSIVFDIKNKEIKVCNDSGRLIRPLLKVKDNELVINKNIIERIKNKTIDWEELCVETVLDESVIEYIDPEEQNYNMISIKPSDLKLNDHINYKYTHCEIHPSTIFGILASCIPFPEHNQSPRNTYQCIDSDEEIKLANGSYKKLLDINIGDVVDTFNEDGSINYGKVIKLKTQDTNKCMYNLTLATNEQVKSTHDHVFYTNNGWKMAEDMKVNDDLVGIDYRKYDHDIKFTDNVLFDFNTSLYFNDYEKDNLDLFNILKIYNNSKGYLFTKLFGAVKACSFIVKEESNTQTQRLDSHESFKTIVAFDTYMDKMLFTKDIENFGLGFEIKDKVDPYLKNQYNNNNNKENPGKLFHLEIGNLFSKMMLSLGIVVNGTIYNGDFGVPQYIYNYPHLRMAFLSGYLSFTSVRVRYNNYNETKPFCVDNMIIYKDNLENAKLKERILNNIFKNYIDTKEAIINRINDLYELEFGFKYDTCFNKFLDIGFAYNQTKQLETYKARVKYYNKEVNVTNWISQGSLVFIPIKSIIPTKSIKVTDITVDNNDHSFILRKGFAVHNCAMGKQAMGMYVTNFDTRMDKTSYVLSYPSRPLVDTRVMNMIELNNVPSGSQIIVAIATHGGYNQEDSILFNKGAIDRGLFQATIYHTEKDEDKKIHGDEEIRCKPNKTTTKGIKFGNYDKLNDKGVINENTLVKNRDIIIGKVVPIKENKNDHTKKIKHLDQSRIYKTTEESYIDKNYIDRNGDGYNFCKVRVRTLRKPVIGDKFSSRHGQKGTIGNIIPEEDMPFSADGVKPDIIINPHAIPSRMTIGQLKETLLGRVLIEIGLFGDGSSFGGLEIKNISDELLKLGYEQHGNMLLMNGLTGEQLETSIFMGPAFYQRLKHMVNDKQHSRSIGPMVNLTRQPAEGRSRDGGLRFGEMERDCMISHGASRFTKGRLFDASDKYYVNVCKKCGLIVAYNKELKIHNCKTCSNKTEFSYVGIPYACKLLWQELITMNIVPRMIT
jgi:DNA-directed RNA polymerase beta subunit